MILPAAAPALLAAALFGISTPLAKWLVGQAPPLLMAGLLYLGSGLGLSVLIAWRHWRSGRAPHAGRRPGLSLTPHEWPWLLGAIGFGGVLGPALLMLGLTRTDGATASLLLNVEAVLTALIAWWVFKENADRRVVIGMVAIVAGGLLLSATPGAAGGDAWAGGGASTGALLIVAACACWAIDNNLTRKVSGHDAMALAALKGLVAGACNTSLALLAGAQWPAATALGASLLVGFLGYGLSLTLFVVGLRQLGAARTGAYFSVAPLFGVLLSLLLWPEWPAWPFWLAAGLMAWGVWLHVTERHEHPHTHEPMTHQHWHRHDAHHQHAHDFAWNGVEPHAHVHRHAHLTHCHAHFPDIHHRHPHDAQDPVPP